MSATLIPGADPWSHVSSSSDAAGALVIHGFTGNPVAVRGLAEAFAAAGMHVEMPCLPGHGTTIDDMLTTDWSHWAGEAEAAYQRLAGRARRIVVAGLSMGGSLTLRIAADHPEVAGLICVNPATQPQPAEVLAVLQGLLADGTTVIPGSGSDIADPDAPASAYQGTPVAPLLSFMNDGLAPLTQRYASIVAPLLLMTSPNDHVVAPAQSDHLAEQYGGPVERVSLDRSFHVATLDYDKELIVRRSVEFAGRVVAAAAAR
jgi:carboxylesterase